MKNPTKHQQVPSAGAAGQGELISRPCRLWRKVVIASLFSAAVVLDSSAQTFSTLADFGPPNGSNPYHESLVQGLDGNYYGTTYDGGGTNQGTVFKVTPAGTLTTIYTFCSLPSCLDGASPWSGLVLATNGNFYGTTSLDGANRYGTVFEITPAGSLNTLYSFCAKSGCTDGAEPLGTLMQGTDGNFYGTTLLGGSNNMGTVFKITPAGGLTTLHIFEGPDGDNPQAGLIQAANGDFYGTTSTGGSSNAGTVFKITSGGALTTLHNFAGPDGAYADDGVIQAANGNFYGTTYEGSSGSVYGTVFEMSADGALTTLHSFDSADGAYPYSGLVQATDGNFYGTTSQKGPNGEGTLFVITPGGVLTTLHGFGGNPDGSTPYGTPMQATNGNLYGTTSAGGTDFGTFYSLSEGLNPFVETLPAFGVVGAKITILGTNLTGATAVAFGGTPATFKIDSSSEITAAVPAGALTGTVQVTLPGSTLDSNAAFRVTPQIKSFTPPSGPVGTVVTITGVSLTQTVRVGFGDYNPAKFTLDSDTQLTATVPDGARSGPIGVETKGGTAVSKQTFTVTE